MLVRPCSPMRLSSAPTPGSCTSQHRKLLSGSTPAMWAVASPMPKPISSTSGAARPNAAGASNGSGRVGQQETRAEFLERAGLAGGGAAGAAHVAADRRGWATSGGAPVGGRRDRLA